MECVLLRRIVSKRADEQILLLYHNKLYLIIGKGKINISDLIEKGEKGERDNMTDSKKLKTHS